ncbi:hypothetical protein PHMEG_00031206, partial [Phytophthora megakarya]
MHLPHAIGLALIVTSVYSFNVKSRHNLNGWYPCPEYTFSGVGSSTGQDAQCAMYSAPLCYPGICKTPKGVDPKVDIFVKRIPASIGNIHAASNVWLLQGGPGASSVDMEGDMVTLHSQLKGAVNVYTMDHRGTGRSTRFDCITAQVTTTGSPFGDQIGPTEVPACAEDLHFKYGDLASFSVTSAATDLATFISKYTNGKSTIVYGVSYGTIFLELLMHLAPPEVTGYVLNGVAATSGAPANEFFYMSTWDTNFDEVGDVFLGLCDEDSTCKAHFPDGLNHTLQRVIDQFDKNPTSMCAGIVNRTEGLETPTPSLGLRSVLGAALTNPYMRTLIPPVVYRLKRCASDDLNILVQFFAAMVATMQTKTQDDAFESILLYSLIVYSEMWESPLPSMSELETRFTKAKMSMGSGMQELVPQYCAFSRSKEKTCAELNLPAYAFDGIVYKRDQYWNKTATIPPHASVLLMSGKLDPQTPNKNAETLLKVLKGKKKELIAFDYASHDTTMTTQMVAGDMSSEMCGMKILASYVRNNGNLKRLDK